MDEQSRLQVVSSKKNGGKILFATDDFFAVAENLLKDNEPEWDEEYTEFGKRMDGWETRRRRSPGHDWVLVELPGPRTLTGACIDTGYFTGNYAPRCSLQAAYLPQGVKEIQNRRVDKMGTAASEKDLVRASRLNSENWDTLVPMTTLKSDKRKHYFTLNGELYTHLRFNIFPDGGIARLHVFGQDDEHVGGTCVDFSDAHYGHPENLLKPGPSQGMFDGWETARRIDRPTVIEVDDDTGFVKAFGEEWAVLKLDKSIYIDRIQVDTTHFKGNCPDNVRIEGAYVDGESLERATWFTVLNRTKLVPNMKDGLKYPYVPSNSGAVNHLKVIIAPDGGLARIRVHGVEFSRTV